MPALRFPVEDPVAVALTNAIREGDRDALRSLIEQTPALVNARLVAPDKGSRTPLHLVTDWPGYFPHAPEAAQILISAGADPNAATTGRVTETPLHWAASSDDLEVAVVLIDLGADIEAPGGSIAGTPLANAVGYGCWHVARLLVDRGARVDSLWQAAALGLMPEVQRLLHTAPAPSQDDLDEAFWQACHGGQRRMAEFLLEKGARIDTQPGYSDQSAIAIASAADTRRDCLANRLQELLDQGSAPPATA